MAGQNNIKFLKYDKSMIDRLKPYGPPKIKWDAGRGKYENVSKKYFEGYGLSDKIYVDEENLKVPQNVDGEIKIEIKNKEYDPDWSWWKPWTWNCFESKIERTENQGSKFNINADWLKIEGFGADHKGSYYLKKQNLDVGEWSENAVVATNTFVGNYIFEQNQSYKTGNRRYIIVKNEDAKNNLKRKLSDYCLSDDEFLKDFGYKLGTSLLGYFTSFGSLTRSRVIEIEKFSSNDTAMVFEYCIHRKMFENTFNQGPKTFYNQNLKLSVADNETFGHEIYNSCGLDAIYGMRQSFPIISSKMYNVAYAGYDRGDSEIADKNCKEFNLARKDIYNTRVFISTEDITRYISDILDVAILLLKNDSSVYKEIADKLFPFVASGGDKEEFQKSFWAYFTGKGGFIDNTYTNHIDYEPILIPSEVGNYSTAEGISKIFSDIKQWLNNSTNDSKLYDVNLDSKAAQDLDNVLIFSSGSGYFDPGDLENGFTADNLPWPNVRDKAELKYHSFSLTTQLFASLAQYARTCGNFVSLLFHNKLWDYYNNRAFIKFVADRLIIAEDSQEMAITKTEEEGPDGEKRERTTLNEFDIRKSVRDITNSIWYLDDYNWSMDRKNLNELGMEITDFQKLRIYELQPDRQISFKRLTESLISAAQSVYNSIGTGALATVIKGAAGTALTATVNSFGTTNIESQEYATNVDWISELLQGTWVGQYDIPFFGKNFLKADTTDGWSMGNLADSADFLKNDLTTNVQDIPTWAYKPGKAEAITTTLYLLNEDVDSIIKNLKFLHSITAGAWWVQTSFVGYRQPNLYRVLCPGRFIMLYSSMAITVEMIGKIRRYSQQDAEEMFGKGAEVNSFMPFKLYTSAGEGNCNIPEAYKLTLKLQDLTPQVFNVMANFFTNGYGNEFTKLYPNIFVKQMAAVDGDRIQAEAGKLVVDVKNKMMPGGES